MAPIEKNKAKILDAAFDIERVLDTVISHHFFGEHNENNEKKTEFSNIILKSDWCTFSSKRKLISHIINDLRLVEGKEKSDYDQLLRKAMSYRNAFAHGQLLTDGREVRLSYFEGKPQVKTLNEDYFTKIETDLQNCWVLTFKVAQTSGAHKAIKEIDAEPNK